MVAWASSSSQVALLGGIPYACVYGLQDGHGGGNFLILFVAGTIWIDVSLVWSAYWGCSDCSIFMGASRGRPWRGTIENRIVSLIYWRGSAIANQASSLNIVPRSWFMGEFSPPATTQRRSPDCKRWPTNRGLLMQCSLAVKHPSRGEEGSRWSTGGDAKALDSRLTGLAKIPITQLAIFEKSPNRPGSYSPGRVSPAYNYT